LLTTNQQRSRRAQKQANYPQGQFRCDFLANGVYVEYFGLTGNSDYDEKTKKKLLLGKKLGIKILALYPQDVVRYFELREKLKKHLTTTA